MRIVHTSDWHAGRIWKGRDRLPELQNVLEHLGHFIERERVDLVLMSGDVYDNASPSAEAERAVTSFFKRIGKAGISSIVIAGNHDSAARLEAWGMLAELVGVTVRGLPRRAADGGLIEFISRGGERARVAAVPFAPVGRLVEALTLARDETAARQQYASMMQRLMDALAEGFSADSINLVLAHTDVSGAIRSGSERTATLGDDWAATPQSLPHRAQYVALGHIHRPQQIESARVRTEYAGSPMQMDFGEIGEVKTFAVIEVEPGLPVRVSLIPYEGAKSLGEFAGTWPELEARAEELAAFGYLRVQISVQIADPDLNRRARRLLPNIVSVDVKQPEVDTAPVSERPLASAPPHDHFAAFYRREHQHDPSAESLVLFDELYVGAVET